MDAVAVTPDDANKRAETFKAVLITLQVIATLTVVCRIWFRGITQNLRYGADDWLCFVSWVLCTGLFSIGMIWANHGLGKHIWNVGLENQILGLKVLYAGDFFFFIAIGVIKLSALHFYRRIFGKDNKGFNIAWWTIHALTDIWIIFAFLTCAMNCIPAKKFWNPMIPGHCLDIPTYYMVSGVWDLVLDLAILILPVPMVLKLQMKKGRKALLFGLFLCGYCSLVGSLGRLVAIIEGGKTITVDYSYKAHAILLWAYVEPPSAIISLCLPSMFNMTKRVRMHGFPALFRLAKHDARYESRSAGAGYTPYRSGRDDEGFVKLKGNSSIGQQDMQLESLEPLEHSARATRWHSGSQRGLEDDGVFVKTEISVEEGRSAGHKNVRYTVG